MNVEANKKELLNWIEKLEDPALIATLQSIRKSNAERDFWSDLPEETQTAINKAKIQFNEGLGIPDKQIRKEVREKI